MAKKYTYFAERLHGDIFYGGEAVAPTILRRYMDEVEDYVRRVSSA